jgi:peptidoglycan hydrolase CwlO-like protein
MLSKKKKIVRSTSVSLEIIQAKLVHIQKDLEENKKDITELKEQIAMGKGGVKVLVWISALVVTVLGYNIWNK